MDCPRPAKSEEVPAGFQDAERFSAPQKMPFLGFGAGGVSRRAPALHPAVAVLVRLVAALPVPVAPGLELVPFPAHEFEAVGRVGHNRVDGIRAELPHLLDAVAMDYHLTIGLIRGFPLAFPRLKKCMYLI